jgi:putative AdoMet-dependent methyltransferase
MTSPNWLYDEFKHIGVDFADADQVRRYDARQQTNLEREQKLVARLGIAAGDIVVEFGPGTGAFSLAAAMNGAKVFAVDISQAMLDYAAAKAAEMKLDTIEFIQSGFLSYRHQAAPPDFVVTKFAFHHLPDFWKAIAIRQIYAMLKVGGQFYLRDVVFSFAPQDYEANIEAWINAVASETGDGFSRADFEMHVRDEYSTYGWILEGMLRQAGFSVHTNYESPTYAEYVCIKEAGN